MFIDNFNKIQIVYTIILYTFIYIKNDLEDKLQTYNKINGAIRRHFGKQMNKERKLEFTT